MEGLSVLRLWSLRPQKHTSVVDAHLRDAVIPAADATDGLLAMFVGRRVVDRDEERIVVTVWESQAAVETAGQPGCLLAFEAELGEGIVELMPIALAIRPEATPSEPGALLRVFRGHVRAGELGVYVDAARQGTLEDIASGAGPIGLYLGVPERDRFVTVSAWSAWERIQIATGGNVQNPIATRHIGHLVGGLVAHYEILPAGDARPSVDPPGSAEGRADAATGPSPGPGLLPELTLAD